MQLEEKIQKAKQLQNEYMHLRSAERYKESVLKEKEYLSLRLEVIGLIDDEVKQRKSITMADVKYFVENMPKEIKYETGVSVLDYELVDEKGKQRHSKGGFTLGNLIQFAGSKGVGKSSLIVKILAGISNSQKVSWFDFEMGKKKAYNIVKQFSPTYENIFYYDGDRDIDEVIKEIKFLYGDGVRHFLIDSTMKMRVKGVKAGYETVGAITSKLSELTSQLDINIYLINQVSQETEKGGGLFMKHGNDSEYDSDYIFFLIKPVMLDINKRVVTDSDGIAVFDESRRVLICTKNRVDHRLFKIDIKKSDIFGVENFEIEYDIVENNVNMPII